MISRSTLSNNYLLSTQLVTTTKSSCNSLHRRSTTVFDLWKRCPFINRWLYSLTMSSMRQPAYRNTCKFAEWTFIERSIPIAFYLWFTFFHQLYTVCCLLSIVYKFPFPLFVVAGRHYCSHRWKWLWMAPKYKALFNEWGRRCQRSLLVRRWERFVESRWRRK